MEDGDFETEPENEFVQNISKHMFNNDTEETEHEKLLESHGKIFNFIYILICFTNNNHFHLLLHFDVIFYLKLSNHEIN